MPLTKLQFKAGVVKDTTAYSNEGGWVDSDKVRFRFGYPEKIGGWESRTQDTIKGTPRALHAWQTLDAQTLTGVGTNTKYYIESSGNIFNITPPRLGVLVPQRVTGFAATGSIGTVTTQSIYSVTGVSATGTMGVNAVQFSSLLATASVGTVTVSIS